jgi:pilus assembly protein Flp/PilA
MVQLLRLLLDRRGATAAEYALILAIVGAAIAVTALFLGAEVGDAMNRAGSCIGSNGGSCPS